MSRKNVVAAGLAERCEIQVSATRSVSQSPRLVSIDTFGTGTIAMIKFPLVREHFDLRPKGLIAMLDLKRPIYLDTAAYGHFGRTDCDFSWERTDKAEGLAAAAS